MRRSTDDLPEYRSRVRGCLLGGALGDALGAPVEFEPIRRIRKQYGLAGLTGLVADWRGEVGLITDDTQMTLFTVEGLIRAGRITVDGPARATGATAAGPAREPGSVSGQAGSRRRGRREEPTLTEETAAVRRAYLRWLDTQQHSSPLLPASSAPSANELVRTGRLREQTWLYSRAPPETPACPACATAGTPLRSAASGGCRGRSTPTPRAAAR